MTGPYIEPHFYTKSHYTFSAFRGRQAIGGQSVEGR